MDKRDYVETLSQLHMPEETQRKVRELEMKMDIQKTRRIRRFRAAAGVAAALAFCFAASNAISYAATGQTWLEKVNVTVNGKKYQTEMEVHRDKQGNAVGEFTIELPEGDKQEIVSIYNDEEETDTKHEIITEKGKVIEPGFVLRVQQKDDKVYLCISDSDRAEKEQTGESKDGRIVDKPEKKETDESFGEAVLQTIDITEDLAKGMAEGEFSFHHEKYSYKVTGDAEVHSIEYKKLGE